MPLQATSGAASYDAFGGGVAAVPNYIEDVFSTYLYTGNGSTQTITNGIDLAGKGGLVWMKLRNFSSTYSNSFVDTARGRSKTLNSNLTAAETTSSAGNDFSSFNNNGFTLGTGFNQSMNDDGGNYASWTFRKQPKFFDVVTYTGTGTASQTVAHNLGSAPGCIIIKRTDSTSNWFVGHTYDANKLSYLNTTAAATTLGWNSWIFDSTTFRTPSISGSPDVNVSGATYVAYLFAHNAGGFGLSGTDNVISCGSFTGTGSDVAVTLGYEPQWLLVKRASSGTDNWRLYDNMRGMFVNFDDNVLFPNLSNAELEGVGNVRPTATGFDVAGSFAASGVTYIYIAIRRGPMKVPTTGTSVFSPNAQNLTTTPTVTTNFPVDLAIGTDRTGSSRYVVDRLRGTTASASMYLETNSTNAEATSSGGLNFANNTGFVDDFLGYFNGVFWNFRRAPGYFDVVCYTGNGSTQNVTHNLGVVPELMIMKERSSPAGWWWNVYYGISNKLLKLNTTDAETTSSGVWNSTAPTSSVFSIGGYNPINTSGSTYVAYLFATCPGVSKVGSYTGTGAIQNIDCGFTAGSRFVMVKRTDAAGGWFVFDSARGLATLNNPYLLLNSTAAEADTGLLNTNVGFRVNTNGTSTVNISGATYIFLAIA